MRFGTYIYVLVRIPHSYGRKYRSKLVGGGIPMEMEPSVDQQVAALMALATGFLATIAAAIVSGMAFRRIRRR